MTIRLIAIVLLAAASSFAQTTKVAAKPAAEPQVKDEVAYPLPLADRDKIRDLQHKNDQLEIEIQKLQLRIAEMRGQQAILVEGIKLVAFDFAQGKKLDLQKFELDPADIKFVRKNPK